MIDAVPDFKTSRQNEQCINKKNLHIHRESMLNINKIYFHVLSPIGNLTVSICWRWGAFAKATYCTIPALFNSCHYLYQKKGWQSDKKKMRACVVTENLGSSLAPVKTKQKKLLKISSLRYVQ